MTKHRPSGYHRYHIETKKAPNLAVHPHRFNVKVQKLGLAKLLLKELWHYRGRWDVVASRPCVYGVFSGPIGGFAPRESLCVGCLRCTTQYPHMVSVHRNPARKALGDHYFLPDYVDTVVSEAETGRVPVRGQGYRGPFGGEGWDGMWMDMSEIVRPTRDGIHGRESISTEVDLGFRPTYMEFDAEGRSVGEVPNTVTIPLPLLFDSPPRNHWQDGVLCSLLVEAARQLQTYVVLPLTSIRKQALRSTHVVPLISPEERLEIDYTPHMIELLGWNESVFRDLRMRFPHAFIALRAEFGAVDLIACYRAGVRVFHLTADYHGRGHANQFILELIRQAHLSFVEIGKRHEVTLIGSGGIIAAEHVPKGILCGLDAVGLDTAVLVALQGGFSSECIRYDSSRFRLPANLAVEWGVQRLKNLAGAWRDQLLEVMGAMGLREVRRMRGEIGRAMFQKNLEAEAFSSLSGYDTR